MASLSLNSCCLPLLVCLACLLVAAEPTADTAKLLETFRTEFVEITPGTGKFPPVFVMGTDGGPLSETPAHEVKFAGSFFMAKYEVPQNLYEAVMGTNPSKWKGSRNSAEFFTVADAKQFCAKSTELLRAAKLIEADQEIRLPTEAEWEYCCRAGTTSSYSFGESAIGPADVGKKASLLDPYGWHTGNAAGNDPPVGALKPNAWGLYDMHGYLWEMVSDAWHPTYQGAPANGSSWTGEEKSEHVIRGGSWKERYECHRSAYRQPLAAEAKGDHIGLRCVLAKVKS